VPTFSVPLQRLQPISGRNTQIFQDLGCIQHVEFPVDSCSKSWRDSHRSSLATAVEKVRRESISERNDHPAARSYTITGLACKLGEGAAAKVERTGPPPGPEKRIRSPRAGLY
jgi:hypothetical protein